MNMNVMDTKVEDAGLTCNTQPEWFQVNCLHVLEMLYYEFGMEKRPLEDGQIVHQLCRYLSVRSFLKQMYGLMRKKYRKSSLPVLLLLLEDSFHQKSTVVFQPPPPPQ
ncbi:hypothetical protein ACF0H5_009407 [Mactra antiquata]